MHKYPQLLDTLLPALNESINAIEKEIPSIWASWFSSTTVDPDIIAKRALLPILKDLRALTERSRAELQAVRNPSERAPILQAKPQSDEERVGNFMHEYTRFTEAVRNQPQIFNKENFAKICAPILDDKLAKIFHGLDFPTPAEFAFIGDAGNNPILTITFPGPK